MIFSFIFLYTVREFRNTCLLLSLDKVIEYGNTLNVPQDDERKRKDKEG